MKYSNEQVRIGISCTKDTEGKVIISISDNGIGNQSPISSISSTSSIVCPVATCMM